MDPPIEADPEPELTRGWLTIESEVAGQTEGPVSLASFDWFEPEWPIPVFGSALDSLEVSYVLDAGRTTVDSIERIDPMGHAPIDIYRMAADAISPGAGDPQYNEPGYIAHHLTVGEASGFVTIYSSETDPVVRVRVGFERTEPAPTLSTLPPVSSGVVSVWEDLGDNGLDLAEPRVWTAIQSAQWPNGLQILFFTINGVDPDTLGAELSSAGWVRSVNDPYESDDVGNAIYRPSQGAPATGPAISVAGRYSDLTDRWNLAVNIMLPLE